MANDMVEISGLWLNESNGKKWMSGYMGNAKILIFRNTYKTEGSNEPDYKMYIAPKKQEGRGQNNQGGQGGQGAPNNGGSQSGPGYSPSPTGFNDDIPFD